MKTVNDIKKVLQVKEGKEITLAQLQEAKDIYVEIAQEAFKNKKYTKSNIALVVLDNAFMRLLETKEVKDLRRTIFINDKGSGYNAVLSKEVKEGKHDNVLSVKFKSEAQVEKLIDDHNFYLVA